MTRCESIYGGIFSELDDTYGEFFRCELTESHEIHQVAVAGHPDHPACVVVWMGGRVEPSEATVEELAERFVPLDLQLNKYVSGPTGPALRSVT